MIKQGQAPRAAFTCGGPLDLLRYLDATCRPGRIPVDLGYLKPIAKREWVQRCPFPPERYGPDWLWTVQLLNAGARMWLTEAPTYEYTIRPGSVSRAFSPARAGVLLKGAQQAYELCSDPTAKRLLQERMRWLQPSVDLSTLRHATSPQTRLAALGRLLVNPTAWRRYSTLGLKEADKRMRAALGRGNEAART